MRHKALKEHSAEASLMGTTKIRAARRSTSDNISWQLAQQILFHYESCSIMISVSEAAG